MIKKRIKFSIYSLLLLFTVILGVEHRSIQAITNEVSIHLPLRQIVTEKSTEVEEKTSFDYKLESKSGQAPLPDGSVGTSFVFSMTGNSELDLGAITYQSAGTYKYSLYQINMNDTDKYTYDEKVYTVTVYVKRDAQGNMIAEIIGDNGSGKKPEVFEFTNSYKKSSTGDNSGGNKPPDGSDDDTNGNTDNNSNNGNNETIDPTDTADGKTPTTGDTTQSNRYVGLILLSGIILIIIYKSRRREEQIDT
ncbi:Spy0128 family protein [Breznakia pachnodae]|uniref:Pilin isopeptide linkage protein n=1 Tax=Breznakia pachnodae TaxID=265178 RepID=A0ABU0E5L9_9FIRM|nr:FctA domain-containing protein [Breznakia pachnodae]MDQ0362167.1 pilin isopeptide linkage protein [Breznakia pachnodae]